ncbi:MAG: metallophosphoesterase [Candidatus Nanoarchaeia archaeon]|nr:metallophosphoesterase [Candidatus Nanoarchaeia archaeon]MDD5741390.1 metallophosphoesterase [Candidatus Nanoarchaeia archaeon]
MKQTRLFEQPRIRFLNNSLLIDSEILVLGDLHLGVQEKLQGLPNIQFKEIFNNLREIFGLIEKYKIKLKKIIVLGDFKHKFGEISDSEWRESVRLLDYFIERVGRKNIILIKGNHDSILEPIARKRKLKIVNFYSYKDIVFMHGHREYKEALKDKGDKIKILILGHLHPTITLTDEYKQERYKCFLLGKWKRKIVYVLPSFGDTGSGYDLARDSTFKHRNGLFIDEKKLKNFEAIIYNNKDKKEYGFGKVKDLMS